MKTTEEKIAEAVATVILLFGALYLVGNVVAAWLRGSFQVVPR